MNREHDDVFYRAYDHEALSTADGRSLRVTYRDRLDGAGLARSGLAGCLLQALVWEEERMLFMVEQEVGTPAQPGEDPRKTEQDTALRDEVDRRVRSRDWQEGHTYALV